MTVMVRKGAMNQGGKAGQAGRGVRLVPGLAVRAGQTIAGKYRVEELIGSGASGVVIAARNVHLREQVTLKIFAAYTDGQDELLERRVRKARLAARLQSEHVARIVDIGVTEDGMPYVATEALTGTTLEAELAERGALSVEEAARWVLEACEGLAEAHAVGLIHGDLKPQNLFLAEPSRSTRSRSKMAPDAEHAPDADPRVLKILDFGTTSPLDAIGDQSASAFFGSPAFLAPEQIQSPETVDPRADVWALGVLLHHLVSGELPFEADTLSGVIVAVVYDAPALLTDAPYELARLVQRCLDKDPARRPQDVHELAAALAPFAGRSGERLSERVRAMLEAPPPPPPPPSGRPALAEAGPSASGSMPPVSLVTAGASTPTRPSRRTTLRRRSRVRSTAAGLIGAAVAIALTSWGATRWPELLSGARGGVAESALLNAAPASPAPAAPVPLAPAPVPLAAAIVPSVVPAIRPADLRDAPARDAAEAAAPLRSFAATSRDGLTPTPLAITPTPLATGEALPPTPTRTVTPATLRSAPPAPKPRDLFDQRK